MNEQLPTWFCPVCNCSIADFKDLLLDIYFFEILQRIPRRICSASIEPNGDIYYIDEDNDSETTSDSDSDTDGENKQTIELTSNRGNHLSKNENQQINPKCTWHSPNEVNAISADKNQLKDLIRNASEMANQNNQNESINGLENKNEHNNNEEKQGDANIVSKKKNVDEDSFMEEARYEEILKKSDYSDEYMEYDCAAADDYIDDGYINEEDDYIYFDCANGSSSIKEDDFIEDFYTGYTEDENMEYKCAMRKNFEISYALNEYISNENVNYNNILDVNVRDKRFMTKNFGDKTITDRNFENEYIQDDYMFGDEHIKERNTESDCIMIESNAIVGDKYVENKKGNEKHDK